MRYINLDQLELPDGWQASADAAIADAAVADEDRKKRDHSTVWRNLKQPLKKLSHDKCYYCEIVQERSDGAVDHFRPKSKYPWSAFNCSNYRFSCTFCNSVREDKKNGEIGGKGDDFPLFDETARATCCEGEVNESPILLDPCKPDEPGLIDFDETGSPIPTYSEEAHAGRNRRATESIKLYHLDHADLVDKRKALAVLINREITVADRLFPQTESGNAAIDSSFSDHVRKLASYISEGSELSAFARRILTGHRDIVWVESLLRSA
ncbi:TIGR02646 family protein [Pseudovibrio denitrificans]|uniref:TIGR02646 family protein n=1 Tax=Pseudovibrio denitrificans TaxID=258256 RepID=A0A1I7DPA6_9HYPH|nr:hypothetical protein [Pseudovibrio denitrificans]SFU13456.1 TIGR02646 family protein [Pseudovibrio denitrificans]